MTRPTLRSLLLVICVVIGVVATAQAQSSRVDPGDQVLVVLKTGETIIGELVSLSEQDIVVRIAGVDSRVRREHVERITRRRTPLERYRSMRAIIDDDDSARLLLLCQWLIDEGLLTEARGELDAVIFFADPATPMGADVDLQALTRLAIMHDTPIALSPTAADMVVAASLSAGG